jgi:hypothetical protein
MEKLEATFSVLTMSIASSAAMALGLAPNPESGETNKDKDMARFNIDLLIMLKEKTKNNLTADENRFLDSVINDLQLKYVQEYK